MTTPSKRIFDCVVPNGTKYANFNSPNVVYLIILNRCFSRYVGETVQERFNWQRTGFKPTQ